jgi:hypothetical protein
LNKKFKIGSLNKFCQSESDNDDQGQGLQIVNEEDELELTANLQRLIRKVRTVVNLISDKKRYSGETYIKEQFDKELQLMMDVKTRWKFWFLYCNDSIK